MILSIGLLILAAVAAQIGPYLVKLAVDVYMPAHRHRRHRHAGRPLRRRASLASAWAMRHAPSSSWCAWATRSSRSIRDQLFRHVNLLAFKFFDDRPAGKIIHRIMIYVDRLQQLVKNGVVNIVADVFRLVLILVLHVRHLSCSSP